MNCSRRLTDTLYWVGANDRRIALFENVYPVPRGVSYNSYLLLDEKTALFDTIDQAFTHQLLENVSSVLDGRSLDYLIVNHMEPDHCASIADILFRYPGVKIVCTAKAANMMKQFFEFDVDQYVVPVKEGDTLSLGVHTLTFVMAPMVHWPEVMVTYETTEKILFSADAFGSFGAIDGNIFADETDYKNQWLPEARRYYCNIVGKYGPQVQALLKKASGLEISMICPLHSLVWRKDLDWLLEKYSRWSSYEPEEKTVLIAYASVYGNTENAANILACRLSERGVKVQMFDTSVTPTSYILSAAFRYSHLVFAATTYNAGVFITMEELLHDIAAHDLQNRRVVLLENGSWAPASGKEMQKILQPLKGWQQMEDTFTIRSALREDQTMQLERLAGTLAADVQAAAPAEEKPEGQHRYVCKVCGYVYEGDSLPEDYKCPLCGAGAEYFKQES